MSGKVLMNVYTVQVKNDLLSIFVQNSMVVLEVQNEHDLLFKHNLIKDNLVLYVHEFDENNYERSMAQLRMIDREKVRCVVMIHVYTSKIIDETLALKVKDVIVLPIDRENLKRKILSPIYKVKTTSMMPKAPPLEPQAVLPKETPFNDEPMRTEISRSARGHYPLSFVLVDYNNFQNDALALFEDELRRLLRTTDEILTYSDNHLLLLCPFTPKTNLVKVENKVREAFSTVNFRGFKNNSVYLYGVTYPDDGDNSQVLTKLMQDGIHDSRLFSELEGPLNRLNQKDVREKLRRQY